MRTIFLYLLAAFVLVSCDNLKKKDAKSDSGDEEVTTKKKKVLDDEESTDEEDVPKKKKKAMEEEEEEDETLNSRRSTDDEEDTDSTNDEAGWSSSDKKTFMNDCTRTAQKNVGAARAEVYCDCMMGKMQKLFSSVSDAERITETQLNKMAADCNQ